VAEAGNILNSSGILTEDVGKGNDKTEGRFRSSPYLPARLGKKLREGGNTMQGMELVVANPDLRSEAMSLAHEIKESEGVDMGTALEQAWAELKGEEWDDMELVEANPPKRRRNITETQAGGLGSILVVAGLGYLGWCWYGQRQTGVWSWQPWKSIGEMTKQRLQLQALARRNNPTPPPVHLSGYSTLGPERRDEFGRVVAEETGCILP